MFKIPEAVQNKYEFVTLAAKRAEQLQMGALPRLDSPSTKVTVVAQEEVSRGLILLQGDEEPAEAAGADGAGDEEEE
jgi:DNA-directed RNA polymerase omega subunit